MEEQQELYERIEQYLSDSLPASERQAFEDKMRQDPALAHEVELHRHLHEAIYNESQDTLVAQAIQKAAYNYFADKPQEGKVVNMLSSLSSLYWLAASVSLVLLIGGGLYFMNNYISPSNQALFASNFTVYEAPVLFRSGEKEEAPILQNAFIEYNQKAYQKAVDLFVKSLQENPRQIVPYFYIGQCKLTLNNPQEAISSFQKVIDHGDNAYVMQAKWYLALAYIDTNNKKQAISLLRELSQQKGSFRERAIHLLSEIEDD